MTQIGQGREGQEMTMGDEDGTGSGNYASPPCFMHEMDPSYTGLELEADARQRCDVMRWRKAERERLIAARLAFDSGERNRHDEKIAAGIDQILGDVSGRMISVYWPFRGEPDLRPWMERIIAQGGACALPVVVKPNAPLVFRRWHPGCKLERGVWNIPIPAAGAEVIPDIVISPLVGFDPAYYRLGYGGGFYDRTLAAFAQKPRVVGVGYSQAKLATIYPQPHDIAMDVIVTETGAVTFPGSAIGAE